MKKVAFICVHNSCRSQIAEALGKHLGTGKLECYSAGTKLKDRINPDAVRLMKELYGIDMGQTQYPKTLEQLPDDIDLAVTMGCDVGCENGCPILPGKEIVDWGLDDPTGKDDHSFREIIKSIEYQINLLVI